MLNFLEGFYDICAEIVRSPPSPSHTQIKLLPTLNCPKPFIEFEWFQ